MAAHTISPYTGSANKADDTNGRVTPFGLKRGIASLAIATFYTVLPSQGEANDRISVKQVTGSPNSQASINAIKKRYAELVAIADDEDIIPNQASYVELRTFVSKHPNVRPPALMLMDDGTFRAIWRFNSEQQVALHFRGNGKVQFVIFILADSGEMERMTGETGYKSLVRKLAAFDVEKVLGNVLVA